VRRAGFTLVEALIATLLLSVVIGALFASVNPLHGRMQAQPEAADQQQRLRVALNVIAAELRNAGAGSLVGAARGPLVRALPPILPYRVGDEASGVRYRPDVISIVTAPRTAAQATLLDGAGSGASLLTVTWPGSCPPATASTVCGFGEGTRALLFDGRGHWDLLTVTSVYGNTLEVSRPGGLSYDFAAGAVVTEARVRVFSLRTDAAGIPHLMQFDGFQSELPVVDHVVALGFEYFAEPQAPQRLQTTPLDAPFGPWTTYGPRPPAVDEGPTDGWPTGESCVFGLSEGQHVARVPDLNASRALVPLDESILTDGPWCPDPSGVAAFDADLYRIRRVRVRARVQVASAALRGARGALFSNAGVSTSAERFVPDVEVSIDVAPSNLASGR
jgi:hypothetical protein